MIRRQTEHDIPNPKSLFYKSKLLQQIHFLSDIYIYIKYYHILNLTSILKAAGQHAFCAAASACPTNFFHSSLHFRSTVTPTTNLHTSIKMPKRLSLFHFVTLSRSPTPQSKQYLTFLAFKKKKKKRHFGAK